ncbi:unnamed protein product [Absidia cylindrospora]
MTRAINETEFFAPRDSQQTSIVMADLPTQSLYYNNDDEQLDGVIAESSTQSRQDQQHDFLFIHSTNKRGKWTPDRKRRVVEAATEARCHEVLEPSRQCYQPGQSQRTPFHLASIREHLLKAARDARKKLALERRQTGTNDWETTFNKKSLELANLMDEATKKQKSEKDKDKDATSNLLWEKRDRQAKQSKQSTIGIRDQQATVVPLILDDEHNDDADFYVDDDGSQGMNGRRKSLQNHFERTMSALEEERGRQHAVMTEMKRLNDEGLKKMDATMAECKTIFDAQTKNIHHLLSMQQSFQLTQLQLQQQFQQSMMQQQQMFFQHCTNHFTKLEHDILDIKNSVSPSINPPPTKTSK